MAQTESGLDDPKTVAQRTYAHLMACACPEAGFDAHVVACILAIAAGQAVETDTSLAVAAGFDETDEILRLFPKASPWIAEHTAPMVVRSEEELCLLHLLYRGSVAHTPLEAFLAGLIARRAQSPNHLWQDLGLANRGELSRLMQEHFLPLARRNRADMKWKKFFYRTLCRDADYALCTAPSCSECGDFDACFGEENGECLLAHTRRKADQAA